MSTFIEKIFTVIFTILMVFALLPFKLVQYAFLSANEMGEYMHTDYHIDREKERGVVFTNSDEDYTRYRKY
tara:strand:+ start:7564 stop:7776 length:213 start_codon:yes stop_codon:yes gene_type:complete